MTEPSRQLTKAGKQLASSPKTGTCGEGEHNNNTMDAGALYAAQAKTEDLGIDLTRGASGDESDVDDNPKYEYIELHEDERGLIVRFDIQFPVKPPDADSGDLVSTATDNEKDVKNSSERRNSSFNDHSSINSRDGSYSGAMMSRLYNCNRKLIKDSKYAKDKRKRVKEDKCKIVKCSEDTNDNRKLVKGSEYTSDKHKLIKDAKCKLGKDDSRKRVKDSEYTNDKRKLVKDDYRKLVKDGEYTNDKRKFVKDSMDTNDEGKDHENDDDNKYKESNSGDTSCDTTDDNDDDSNRSMLQTQSSFRTIISVSKETFDTALSDIGCIKDAEGDADNIYDAEEGHSCCRWLLFAVFRRKRRYHQTPCAHGETPTNLRDAAGEASDPEVRKEGNRTGWFYRVMQALGLRHETKPSSTKARKKKRQ